MMAPFYLSEVCSQLGATLIGSDFECLNVSTDSRNLQENTLFVAIKGVRFNGHDFVAGLDTAQQAALVSEQQDCDVSQLLVDDTLLAFGKIARLQRDLFKKPVIGLTGSCGKTSTKEMIAAVLQTAGNVFATRGNLNNEIGVPRSLMEISPGHDFAVIEMGAAEKGDIAYLCQFAKPDIALVTNVHEAHIGRFGSLQTIVETKGEIYKEMNHQGTALVNVDDEAAAYWLENNNASQIVTFAVDNTAADIYASNIQLGSRSSHFQVTTPKDDFEISLQVPGKHSVYNALAAIAVAFLLEVPVVKVQQALASFQSVSGRGQFLPGFSGSLLIDETYNANPGSVKASIDMLMAQDASQKILVLADMAELGEQSDELHQQVGRYAKNAGVKTLLAFGEQSQKTSAAFGEGGQYFSSKQDLVDELKSKLSDSSVVLIKGSRSMQMEDVVHAVQAGGQH